jgi:ABC-type glutathione transport system ATPase component
MSDGPIIEVENLTVDFAGAGRPALSSIDFALRRNEVLGIFGETGAGKSVLARSLINLPPAGARITAGDVRFDGRSIFRMAPEAQRRLRGGHIALMGTDPKALLDPVRRVGEQVADVLRSHTPTSRSVARQVAVTLFDQIGIVDPERRADAYPHQLSGGMAQRVVIAMALVANPQVILADDATLGLDATIQVQVLDLLVARCRTLGTGLVLITHDLGIIARYCDRIGIMREGRLIELERVAAFFAGPKQPESRKLLAAAKVQPPPLVTTAASAQAPLVTIEHLTKTFLAGPSSRDVVRAVDDVSLTVRRGETVALVGESGSGKTTIGQCLVHLQGVDSGSMQFDGMDITALSQARFRPVRRRIQMVFQEPYIALNPRWPVESLIAEPLALLPPTSRPDRAARVGTLLDLVGLPQSLRRAYPHQLTAGEQKRVGIARALATEPDFVVFDEPTTALDVRVRAQIIELIRDLQQRIGLTVLFITHDLNSVRSLAHRVAVMQRGRIVETGVTEAIFNRPRQDYTRALLAAELPIAVAGQAMTNEKLEETQ